MSPDPQNELSAWHRAWLAADAEERARLEARLAIEHPELVAQADALTIESGSPGSASATSAFTRAAHVEPLLPPDTMVGPYRIVSLLARGGMGDVYRAHDVRLRRDVALKMLPHTSAADRLRVDRFVQEAQVTASLDHPNVVRLYDVGISDGRPYFVAELLEGETLRARISRGPLPAEDARRIASDVARGLVAAHESGLVHRDLKPENIFLTRSGVTKVLDFGIAKLEAPVSQGLSTSAGVVLGTPGYLAPEQVRGEAVDARADLFALGAVLFEMLTGARAFQRDHTVDTLHAILYDPPPALLARNRVPPALTAIVTRLLEKSLDARFATSAELVAALEDATPIAPGQAAVPPTPTGETAVSPMPVAGDTSAWPGLRLRTAPTKWMVAALALVVLLAGVVAGWMWRRSAAPAVNASAPTLAVIPFRSLPESPDAQLLELGLADVLIGRLSQLPGVRVLPLTATERLRGADPSDGASQLGADRVLTGTVQRDQDRVRASVQLVSSSDRRTLWSTSFDEHASTAFAIQDAIVARVIGELAPRLAAAVQTRLAKSGTRNEAAYEAHLKGRALVVRATGPELKRAAASFREALELDPEYVDAWAGLAAANVRLSIVGDVDPAETFAEARRTATKAQELDPDHAEARAVLGLVAFWHDWDYPRAETLLRDALVRQPSSTYARVFLAHLLSNLGRHREALDEMRLALELDPAWPVARSLEAQCLTMAGRADEALARMNALLELEPRFIVGHYQRTLALLALRRYDEAIGETGVIVDLEANLAGTSAGTRRTWQLALRGYGQARAGRARDAETTLAQIKQLAASQYVPAYHEALVLHALGLDEQALARLGAAVDARDVFVTFLGVDPKWDKLRTSPEFKALASRVNLLDVSSRTLAARR